MRLGLGVVAESATVAADTRVIEAPLGQAVATQYTDITARINVARTPDARDDNQLVVETNGSTHFSRTWL